MRLRGPIYLSAVAVVVAVGVVALLSGGGTQSDPGAVAGVHLATDLESRLGVRAEQEGKVEPPRSLDADAAARKPATEQLSRPVDPATPRPRPVDRRPPPPRHLLVRVQKGGQVPVRARPGGPVLARLGHRTEFGSPTVLGVAETAGAWAGVSTAELPNGRLGWVHTGRSDLALDRTARSIHISLSRRRATLRHGGRALRSFTVTIGAAGTETPTGRFAVTDTFRGDLNPVYGCCAVALTATQPDLPPGWPGGNRIAIHGNGTGQPLGDALSNGCLRAEDGQVSALVDQIELGAPVFIAH